MNGSAPALIEQALVDDINAASWNQFSYGILSEAFTSLGSNQRPNPSISVRVTGSYEEPAMSGNNWFAVEICSYVAMDAEADLDYSEAMTFANRISGEIQGWLAGLQTTDLEGAITDYNNELRIYAIRIGPYGREISPNPSYGDQFEDTFEIEVYGHIA